MINLDEIVYQVNGRLDVGPNCEIVLRDNIDNPVVVRLGDGSEVEARATGSTIEEARYNLVVLLRGRVLRHQWPVPWDFSSAYTRVPDSLMSSDIIIDFVEHG